jgi:hypothetical protein
MNPEMLAIGMLTAAYTAEDDQERTALIAAAVAGVDAELAGMQAEEQMAQHVAIAATLIAAFRALAHQYKTACPDADIPGLLQKIALALDNRAPGQS